MTIYSLKAVYSYLEPVCCSTSSSNCCLLTCIQISQEAGQVVWYSYLLKNFPQFIVIHTVKGFGTVNKAEIDVFLQEYTEELYKKDLYDLDNHNGVIIHLEPDILECEVKWALGSITTNKASGGDEFQLSYFKCWKMMLWKCCTQFANKFGKLSSGHRTGKGQFSFQSQRKATPKNAQTTAQLPSSHTLVK